MICDTTSGDTGNCECGLLVLRCEEPRCRLESRDVSSFSMGNECLNCPHRRLGEVTILMCVSESYKRAVARKRRTTMLSGARTVIGTPMRVSPNCSAEVQLKSIGSPAEVQLNSFVSSSSYQPSQGFQVSS